MSRIKTTINIDPELWKRFSILVIKQRGCQKKNEVIEELIRKFVESEEKKHG